MIKQKKEENMEEFQKKLEEQQNIIEDYTNTLKRLQADFENYVKKVEKEKEEFTKYSNHKLIAKLLTTADDFDKALDVMKKDSSEIASGIEIMYKQFYKILQEEGVLPIIAVGNKLDPYKHEVIDIVIGNEDGLVVEEIQRGYMIKDKVLRPSKVRISRIGE